MITLSEAFYYSAFRLRALAQRLGVNLPLDSTGLARNHLIEHPEKNDVGRGWPFAYGAALPAGPVLRPFGISGDRTEDVGLYAIANKFVSALVRRLATKLSESTTEKEECSLPSTHARSRAPCVHHGAASNCSHR